MIHIHPEVVEALHARRPVVALETAVLTHGLPRATNAALARVAGKAWEHNLPANLALARAMEREVREAGAVPATLAVLDGKLCAGLSPQQLERLALDTNARKLSARDLGAAIAQGASGGLTVAATLAACTQVGIQSFATGGIGGVHRGWTQRPDVSADLAALAHARVVVTCAGAKSILDLPATLECLDSLGVPVIGIATPHFPCFTCPPDPTLPVSAVVQNASQVAAAALAHWNLGQTSAILAVQPCPVDFVMQRSEFDLAVQQAESEAAAQGIHGGAVTPFLLGRLAQLTDGTSLFANVALLLSNATTAAQISKCLLDLQAVT